MFCEEAAPLSALPLFHREGGGSHMTVFRLQCLSWLAAHRGYNATT